MQNKPKRGLRGSMLKLYLSLVLVLFAGTLFVPCRQGSGLVSAQEPASITFAAIGDYGSNEASELDVANLVKSWNPDFIITLGDNNYPDGEAATIDANIGQYYHEFIYPYKGAYGNGANTNRFWPSIGNHDWENQNGAKLQPYLDYFTLPNNERYYDFVRGPVHFFVLDSESIEPDGTTSTSIQAQWLRSKLTASTSPWKIVYLHNPPYSSRTSWTKVQWPYYSWGANAVIAGNAHVYERVMRDGIPYFTNGLGGESKGSFVTAIAGSVVRFGEDYGAMRMTASASVITFEFITRRGVVIDSFTIGQQVSSPAPPSSLTASAYGTNQINLGWTDNANNESGFQIERCTGAGCTNFSQIAQPGTNVINYADSGLAAGTPYRYRVRAFNGNGNSSYSNIADVSTGTNPLAAPTNLDATAVSTSQIDIVWKDNSTSEDGFKLYRSTDGVTFTRTATLGPNVTFYSNTGRPASTTYYYRVLAFNASGTSDFSNTDVATTFAPATVISAAPTNLVATALSSSQIRLAWTDNANNEKGFKLYRSLDGSSFVEIAKPGVNATGYTDASLASKTTYYYRVRSYNDAGSSAYSNTTSARTP